MNIHSAIASTPLGAAYERHRAWQRFAHRAGAVIAAAALLAVSVSLAAPPGTDPQAQYRADVAACQNGPPSQDKAACLREAAAARAQRGSFDSGVASTDYQRNALRRCDPLPRDDQAACRARIEGQGITRGSVREGGIYREYTERAAPPALQASPLAPAAAPMRPDEADLPKPALRPAPPARPPAPATPATPPQPPAAPSGTLGG